MKNYCKKQKIDIIIVVVKKKLLNNIFKMNNFQIRMQDIGIETCQKKKKKRKGNTEEKDTM